jgi:hypothetical protein
MKTYEGVDTIVHTFLTSELDTGEWSAARHGRFDPGKRAAGTHWIGDSRADLDVVAKTQNPCPCRESNPGRPAHNIVIILTAITQDNIKMDLKMGYEDVNCTQLYKDRAQWRALVNTIMNLRVSQQSGKLLTS